MSGDPVYIVNEIFYSLQGEGVRSGTPNVFVRLSRCNLACTVETHGFDCDTEFESGRKMALEGIVAEMIDGLHAAGYKLAIETNGSIELPPGIDWITVSPKVAEHAVRQRVAHEVKYVRGYGQAIPRTVVKAEHYLISPAFEGDQVDPRTLDWCIRLCRDNPPWRLSVQQHKLWRVR